MNVDFRCEHCGKLLSAPAHANEPVRCPHCQKLTAVPAGLASLPRPQVQGEEPSPPVSTAAPREGTAGEPETLASGGELAGVLETIMPFVISLFFHLGLILVTVFLVAKNIGQKPTAKEIVVPTYHRSGEPGEAGGSLTPPPNPTAGGGGGGSRFNKVTDSSAQSSIITSSGGGGSGDAYGGLGVIGIGTSSGGSGAGGTGVGTGTGDWFGGGPAGDGPGMFGIGPGTGGGVPKHYVYVVDRSGSMLHTFDAVKLEMMKSIGGLEDARGQEFHVILFADGPPLEATHKRLVSATEDSKASATAWLTDQSTKGKTDPIPALNRAFDVLDKAGDTGGGKVIFLLTDSAFPDNDKVIQECRRRNAKRDVVIYTLLYYVPDPGTTGPSREAEKTMKKVAEESGGVFRAINAEE